MIERSAACRVVIDSLRETLQQSGAGSPPELGESTVIVGKDAVLDSLGVVSLIVEVEQRIEAEHGVTLTLANDRAMSQRSSPFRTVGVLADHVCASAAEVRQS